MCECLYTSVMSTMEKHPVFASKVAVTMSHLENLEEFIELCDLRNTKQIRINKVHLLCECFHDDNADGRLHTRITDFLCTMTIKLNTLKIFNTVSGNESKSKSIQRRENSYRTVCVFLWIFTSEFSCWFSLVTVKL